MPYDEYYGCFTDPVPVDGYYYGDLPIYSDEYSLDYCAGLTVREGCREAITLLKQVGGDESNRTLIAATKSRIYASNDYTGNWRIIADGLGGSFSEDQCLTCVPRRFSAAQLGNYVAFTNNFDPVIVWRIGDPPAGCNLWGAEEVIDLRVVGLQRAKCIAEFNGFLILGNVQIEGESKSSRIYWSDYNAPLSWIPSDQSLANFHEFGLGERVLRIEPLGKFLFVYTDKAIYQGVFVADPDLVFQFNTIPTDSPLRYEHSLVNTGRAHIYLADNGVYVVTANDPRPSRYEWMHKSDASIYVGIGDDILVGFEGLDAFGEVNNAACEQVVGGYNQLDEEVWFSWPTDDNACPNMSLVLNLRYEAADLVDHGFTAFANYKPDYRPILRDWLHEEGVCVATEEDFLKEGLPNGLAAGDEPPYIWNEDEDPELPSHELSWCVRLGDTTIADLCVACEGAPVFVMADAHDFTLKEGNSDTYYRESYDVDEDSYTQDGYYTMLQSDMAHWGVDEEKILKMLAVDYDAIEQEPPSELTCEVSHAAQPRCPIWKSIGERELRCLTDSSAAQHATNNTRPDMAARYQSWYRGRYIGWRIWTGGTGGGVCFSRAVLTMSKAQARLH